ncbi:uncharacterized protein CANTADRAFT_48844 [Suhomyces tanzawaensis NRRL Y-17324]|uniref:Peroxisomal membrane protein PEX14 n=1 Tax=Suhomyces tanzawaensis NRRL Y-17324 TaxID=984487 RepID=A0A1E4SKT1_9ASCO|nr:uncharacterized protein CANTADRAFT_48844 [Suhomyces tanzawaensis NRRL Y-17324]ODV80047.1 hypothetical protein CANTADRAFT_48844 [Suhomyces tanzawaensis NRRL Y-17324]
MNEELIKSAVAFLKDPNVNGLPLTKKIEFLESKGLGQQEIEEALKRAGNGATTSSSSSTASTTPTNTPAVSPAPPPSLPIDYYNAPAVPERSWKDYFIMATATVGVTYAVYQVASKYLIPSIIPPSQTSIEKDKQKIDEEFIKIDKILEQLSEDQTQIKEANEAKLKEIDVVIDNVNDFLSKYNKDKLKFDDDLRLMKLEIDNLSNSVEKNMALTKENIRDELVEINEELQSLKQLLKNRSGTPASTTERKLAPVSSIPSASEILKRARAKTEEKKPEPTLPSPEITDSVSANGVTSAGIPAWQMKHKQQEEGASAEPAPTESKTGGLNEDAVKKNIDKIGVPSWQLNAGGSSTSAGIPEWQLNASSNS